MYNFHFGKVIAGVGPLLAKETILSKVINMVDIFRISMSNGFDDNNKKYIETVMKLDNSKTIMMETKWADLRIKNVKQVSLKKNQKILVDYSEYAQEADHKVFVDYPFISHLKPGVCLLFRQSGVVLEVVEIIKEEAQCVVTQWGTIIEYDRLDFEGHDPEIIFLTDKDKKDITRGIENGVHIICGNYVRAADDIMHLKTFLANHQRPNMKVFAKIETPEAIQHLQSIVDVSDGIIVSLDLVEPYFKKNKLTMDSIIALCKDVGKPAFLHYAHGVEGKSYPLLDKKHVLGYCEKALDGYMIETMINEDDPLRVITALFEVVSEFPVAKSKKESQPFYHPSDDFLVRDYIIYNAHKITEDLDVKAIVCFTHNGYTTARLSALNPAVPIIAFSSVDETYRYINTLRGVKGFKISPHFNYTNLKRIGKEMIRIIFKWNISLDDKIVIVQANELINDEKTDLINGVELYAFKNI